MSKQIGANEMRELANTISKSIPGLGFAIIVFEFNEPGVGNYISNAQRSDMIKAFNEVLSRWKNNEDFTTPEEN